MVITELCKRVIFLNFMFSFSDLFLLTLTHLFREPPIHMHGVLLIDPYWKFVICDILLYLPLTPLPILIPLSVNIGVTIFKSAESVKTLPYHRVW